MGKWYVSVLGQSNAEFMSIIDEDQVSGIDVLTNILKGSDLYDDVYIQNYAKGSSVVDGDNYNAPGSNFQQWWYPDSAQYGSALTNAIDKMRNDISLYGIDTNAGDKISIVWSLGETDANLIAEGTSTLARFKEATLDVFTALRTEFGENIEIFISKTGENNWDFEATPPSDHIIELFNQGRDAVQQAQEELANEYDYIHIAADLGDYTNEMPDRYHYTNDTYEKIAGDIAFGVLEQYMSSESIAAYKEELALNLKLYGTVQDDVMYGEFADDRIYGNDGDDTIYGRAGDDLILGNDGDDKIYASDGIDTVYGGNGNDTIHGHHDRDKLFGGVGDDIIFGGTDSDYLFGNQGHDIISGGSGGDFVYAGDGNDHIYGDDGSDILFGQDGDDVIVGGIGTDLLNGGNGDDLIFAGDGNDHIKGGAGNDTMLGGAGYDRFIFEQDSYLDIDLIFDFTSGQDRLDISALLDSLGMVGDDGAVNQLNVSYDQTIHQTTATIDNIGFELHLMGNHSGLNVSDFVV